MIDPLPDVALPHLLPDQPRHHAPDPLLAQHRILRGLQLVVVVVVDAVKGGGHFGLAGQEQRRLGRGHCAVFSRRGGADSNEGVSNVGVGITVDGRS